MIETIANENPNALVPKCVRFVAYSITLREYLNTMRKTHSFSSKFTFHTENRIKICNNAMVVGCQWFYFCCVDNSFVVGGQSAH